MSARNLLLIATIATSWFGASIAAAGQLSVGNGSAFSLGSASLDLGCSSLIVAGDFDVGTGSVAQVLDLTIASAGALANGNGSLEVTGDWDNSNGGTFFGDTGSVNFVDGCGRVTATISGSTSFATLTIVTSTGKTWEFEAGSTQTIVTSFTVMGVDGNLAVLRSASPGNEANFSVTGTVNIDFVDIDDIFIGPGLNILGPNSTPGSNLSGFELCGDIDGSFAIDAPDVTMARENLVGKTILGDITLCNVIGPFDPAEGGADCTVEDIFVLERLVRSLNVSAENGCAP